MDVGDVVRTEYSHIGCLPILPAVHIIININMRKIYNVEVIDDYE